jgi:hypothetical protein
MISCSNEGLFLRRLLRHRLYKTRKNTALLLLYDSVPLRMEPFIPRCDVDPSQSLFFYGRYLLLSLRSPSSPPPPPDTGLMVEPTRLLEPGLGWRDEVERFAL